MGCREKRWSGRFCGGGSFRGGACFKCKKKSQGLGGVAWLEEWVGGEQRICTFTSIAGVEPYGHASNCALSLS